MAARAVGQKLIALIAYARVSTEDQITDRQLDKVQTAGCTKVLEEQASGGNRDCPILAQALVRQAAEMIRAH